MEFSEPLWHFIQHKQMAGGSQGHPMSTSLHPTGAFKLQSEQELSGELKLLFPALLYTSGLPALPFFPSDPQSQQWLTLLFREQITPLLITL